MVEPTPTALVVNVDTTGSLDSGVVLARTSDGVGGVLTIPAGTLVPGGISEVPLRYVYDTEGVEAYAAAVGNLLGLTFGDVRVVGADEWEGLVAPSGPITVNSPDPVIAADGTVLFPRGSLELTAGPGVAVPVRSGHRGERPRPDGPGAGVLERLARPDRDDRTLLDRHPHRRRPRARSSPTSPTTRCASRPCR